MSPDEFSRKILMIASNSFELKLRPEKTLPSSAPPAPVQALSDFALELPRLAPGKPSGLALPLFAACEPSDFLRRFSHADRKLCTASSDRFGSKTKIGLTDSRIACRLRSVASSSTK